MRRNSPVGLPLGGVGDGDGGGGGGGRRLRTAVTGFLTLISGSLAIAGAQQLPLFPLHVQRY